MRFLLGIIISLVTCESVISIEHSCSTGLPFHCSEDSCVRRSRFCDGTSDCANGKDEILFDSDIHNRSLGLPCVSNYNDGDTTCLLPNKYLCDHEPDCVGGLDECGCESTFQCYNGDCSLKIQFCDGVSDCADGTDETIYNKTGFQCQVTKKHETKSCVLPDVHVCDGDSECNWGTDECFCDFSGEKGVFLENTYSNEKCFRCLDGSLVIPTNHVCDGIVHCKDLSDECLCEHNKEGSKIKELCAMVCTGIDCECPGQLQCVANAANSSERRKICLNSDSICDDRFDCSNSYDESFCALDTELFSCIDKTKKIKKTIVCDGVEDCLDGSDEFLCHETKHICNLYKHPRFFPNVTGWEHPSTYPRLNRTIIVERFKRYNPHWPYYAEACDGIPLCVDMDDECNNTLCPGTRPGFCDFADQQLRCPNSDSILIGYEVCDGTPTCNDTAPEQSMDEFGCDGRFYCKNNGSTRLPIHIPLENRCDGKQECDDQSDELDCNTDGNITHFYCEDGGSTLFIPIEQKCDKRKDCKEGGDECDNCEVSPFSSDEKLIKSRVLIVFLWVIGLVATIGNTAVIIHQIVNLSTMVRNGSNDVAVKNRILVLNLAIADLLVGLYLISLGIKDSTVDRYCLQDQEWRSSTTCSGLGAIAVIGTEASVLMLAIMTAYRLYLVHQPFQNQRMIHIAITIVCAWVVAIILGTAPLAATAQDYFLSCVWFRSHRYLGYACKSTITDFTKKLIALEGPKKLFSTAVGSEFTWSSMLTAQKLLNPIYEPERYFGYYSAHSVCLPRLFPDRQDDLSWGYSLFLVLLNFSSFVFIFAGYIIIYKRTTKKKVTTSSSGDRAASLQRKVTRIVLTDFCCWMPICIMAFIRVSGVDIGDDAYAVTAIILLPINSAMNPFLYSSLLDIIWEKMIPIRQRFRETSIGRIIHDKNSNSEVDHTAAKSMKRKVTSTSSRAIITGSHR